jgi:hypothetical protein
MMIVTADPADVSRMSAVSLRPLHIVLSDPRDFVPSTPPAQVSDNVLATPIKLRTTASRIRQSNVEGEDRAEELGLRSRL